MLRLIIMSSLFFLGTSHPKFALLNPTHHNLYAGCNFEFVLVTRNPPDGPLVFKAVSENFQCLDRLDVDEGPADYF